MVGKRYRDAFSANDDQSQTDRAPRSRNDLETGMNGSTGNETSNGSARPRPRIWRFKDAAITALGDQRREELKNQLLSGADRNGLEKFRKSDEELKDIKNKKVRAYYEAQNERL